MENDDKISTNTQDRDLVTAQDAKRDIEIRNMLELLQRLSQDAQERSPYNLEEEFGRAARNRNYVIPIIIFSTLILFGFVIYGATELIGKRNREMGLSIGSFEDLRLKDLLSEASRNKGEMERAVQGLSALETALATETDEANRTTEQKINLLRNENLSGADYDLKAGELRSEGKKLIAGIRGKYQPQIDEVKKRIAAIQKKIDAYDARLVEQARKQEKQLDNQRLVFDLEKTKIVNGYEERLKTLEARYVSELAKEKTYREDLVAQLKRNHEAEIRKLINRYNPDLSGTAIGKYLSPVPAPAAGFTAAPYRSVLGSEKVLVPEKLNELHDDVKALTAIIDALSGIPYEPTIRSVLQNMAARNGRLSGGYERLWSDLAGVVESKNLTIEEQLVLLSRYRYALEFQTGSSRENGYVIDPRNASDILVYMDPRRPVPDNSSGYVFRNDDEFIGTLRFRVSGDGLRASLESLVAVDIKPEPFDKILLRID